MANKKFLSGIPAMALAFVFGLVLAGCATTTGGAEPSAAAEQLAADINAIKPGSAEVNGSTVTLTGDVRLENALTVPSGVTLDGTKSTLLLAGNAVFTVNGAVNAKAEGIAIDSAAANPATINGSGTISLQSKGRLLNIGGSRKLILDGVTLVGLPDNSDTLVRTEGGEFVLKSGKITGNTNKGYNANGGGVGVWENGTFTMQGGTISGNTAQGGGEANGGGVYLNSASFIMEGGVISGNTSADIRFAGGGGVAVMPGSTFTMRGGTISGNTAKGGDSGEGAGDRGGGVNVPGATFIMEGGTIYGNADKLPVGADASLANSAMFFQRVP